MSDDAAALAEALHGIGARLLAGGGQVSNLARLSGGASQETWAFRIEGPTGEASLILRRAPGARITELQAGLETEAELLRLAGAAGVPVPKVRHVLAPGDHCGRGFIMERLEGETIPRKLLRDAPFAQARERLTAQCGQALARIHALPLAGLPATLRRSPGSVRLAELHASFARLIHPNPVFALALRWLETHLPPDPPLALVHGDFRIGNLMVGPEGLRGVLDWELAHLGDPMEDLGWICTPSWRFGQIDQPVGGFGQRQALYAAYEAAGGGRVDPDRARFWEVFGALQWGLMCAGMGELYVTGQDVSVERGMIGRRVSETEIDLLDYILPLSEAPHHAG